MEVEGGELVSLSIVELVLELDPVESQRVEVALQRVHDQQHAERDQREEHEEHVERDGVAALHGGLHDLAPEHLRELYDRPVRPFLRECASDSAQRRR